MITLGLVGKISPIFLTVLLIGYLILVELGNEKIRKALLPLVIVLIAVFLIIAVMDIISKL
jgi:hypothetical protein